MIKRLIPKRTPLVHKARVYDIGDPTRYGTIITLGEQVSEVRWEDNKSLRYVSNKFLRVKEE